MDYIEHIIKAKRGDIKSYEYLVANFQDMAISYAYSILHDFQLAEDAAQEAFILLYRNIISLHEPKAFIAWFRRLVFTCCTRITRKAQHSTQPVNDNIAYGNTPFDFIEEQEKKNYINQALHQLSNGQREVFLLYYMFNKSYDEIASELGISNSAVANRLYSGKKKLKDIMKTTMIDYLEDYDMDEKVFTKKVLNNILRIYEIKSENYMFDACMHSAMKHLNEDTSLDYVFFAGVTGDLFTQIWCSPNWQYNDSYSTVCRDSQLPIKAAFDACGYEYEYIQKEEIKNNMDKYIAKIKTSIDKGVPVLTFGIVGPPVCSIICGYDDDGDVLMGWAQFQDNNNRTEPNGYFRKRNGLEESQALIYFGPKKATPSPSESIRKSILNIPQLVSKKPKHNILFGKDAFEAWADSLLCHDYYLNENMLDGPFDTYGSCIVLIGTNMHYIQSYLNRALELCPDMSEQIRKLKQAYEEVNKEFLSLITLQGGYFFDKKRLLDATFRKDLAKQIRRIGIQYNKILTVFDISE